VSLYLAKDELSILIGAGVHAQQATTRATKTEAVARRS